ncbi:unnamed protein product [Adineta ricciae]|uniref:DYW domain-containing protein n=2 Tax=Adineta ricciae TaxID=249248 RepID=A0A815CCU0_ADIRI|nr:unnamed protein product [Adineta ricciae]
MSKMFTNRCLRSVYVNIQWRIPIIRRYSNLDSEMKRLNDEKRYKEALTLFVEHEQKGQCAISDIAINQALKSSTNMKDFSSGLKISSRYSSRIEKNSFIQASLIHFYMQFGDINRAREIFRQSENKTKAVYGALMRGKRFHFYEFLLISNVGFIKNNMFQEAVDLFSEIIDPDEMNIMLFLNACSGIATKETLVTIDKVLSNIPNRYRESKQILIAAYDAFIKCGDLPKAEKLFPKIERTVRSYGNLMNAYNNNEQPEKTFKLYKRMKTDGIKANFLIYVFLLNACANLGVLSISQSIYEQIPKTFLDHPYVQTALIDMWGKSSCIDKAKNTFESIIEPDTSTYTSMINVYGLNGMALQAVELFRRMPSELVTEATYICVLNACSHSGLVNEAQAIFSTIKTKTEHIYATMVDCFSRLSLFDEAQELVDVYESCHSPSSSMLMALLSGARNRNDCFLAEKIFNRIQQNFSQDRDLFIAASVLLGNIYASTGDLEKAAEMKKKISQIDVKKKLAWLGQKNFELMIGSHPRSDEIYAEGEKISRELVSRGHQYGSSWITRVLGENETTESVLYGHSERLAIAWNFVVNPHASTIQITKNLRVCGDCHQTTKRIALLRQCDIIVRDANRIHHFYKTGQCSCNDHF